MYSIGDFSRINRITPKTLRHYDRIGLLKPAMTDEWTGYRYYDPAQLPAIRRILMLKDLGFSLAEVGEIVSGDAPVEDLLRERERDLERAIREEEERLRRVRGYLTRLTAGEEMDNEISIKRLPEVMVASMRTTVPGYDTFFDVVPKMGDYMRSVGVLCREPEYCFTIYHNGEYRDHDIDVEICEAVVEACEESESVKFKTIDAVEEAACVMHHGPYERLGETYNRVYSWINSQGYEPADNPRESYIDGIWNKEDPEEWLTEVQVPVRRGSS